MAKPKTIFVTYMQGTQLLNMTYMDAFPEQVGDPSSGGRKFSPTQIVTIVRHFRILNKAIKKVSTALREHGTPLFGDPANWKLVADKDHTGKVLPKELHQYEVIDRARTVELQLTGDSRDAAYWSVYLMCAQGSKYRMSPGNQEELAWPVAAAIGAVSQLEEDIGLSKRDYIKIVYDDDDDEKKDGKHGDNVLETAETRM